MLKRAVNTIERLEGKKMNDIITRFEALLNQGQDNALLRLSLGQAYLKEKVFDQAIRHLKQAIEFDAEYSAAWKVYAKALAAKGDEEAAIVAYTQGIYVAEKKGDKQAVKEMQVFLKRLQKNKDNSN